PFPLMPGAVGFQEYQQRLIKAWYWLRKPTIAAIHGHCHGFGHDVALCADFRIASSNAIMGDIRAKRAILVGSGGTYLLTHMIGLPEATRLMLTGDLIDAQEIQRLGLATVVPAEEFDQKVEELARKLAAGPTKAMGVL